MTNRFYNESFSGALGGAVTSQGLNAQFELIQAACLLIQEELDSLQAIAGITSLSGFPSSFSGQAGKQLVVNAGETAVEFVARGFLNYKSVSGTTYTLLATDPGYLIATSNGSAVTVTVPPNADASIAVGGALVLAQYGAGQVTVAPGSGVTLRSAGSLLKTRAQFSQVTLIKVATNEWLVGGDLGD